MLLGFFAVRSGVERGMLLIFFRIVFSFARKCSSSWCPLLVTLLSSITIFLGLSIKRDTAVLVVRLHPLPQQVELFRVADAGFVTFVFFLFLFSTVFSHFFGSLSR